MNNITFNDFIELVKSYNPDEVEIITKAYNYAKNLHNGQKRQSGEDYIIHPLNVAYILAEMHADRDTICAGLLHDTLEDTNITKDDIAHEFNPTIAYLVDGVTKISKMNFSTKEAENYANTRKIITSLTTDVRIIIIKLADRLHNMRTLEFKSEFKQKENALETMEIFVPLAYYIGAYRIKCELEDLAFKYLKPDIYNRLLEKKNKIEKENYEILEEVAYKIKRILDDKNIPNEMKLRTKNIYSIYKKMNEGLTLYNIHDLLALKVMVDDIDNCYRTLGVVHSIYNPVNSKFKDFIYNPKTNMYRSIHTTVFARGDRLVQTQIRTFEMDKIASFGLPAYWDINKGQARIVMQEDLKNKYQFFKSLVEINSMFGEDKEFVNKVKKEIFSDNVYVFIDNGEIIELPKGSTLIDLAYRVGKDIGDTMIYGFVNDSAVGPDYILNNKDRVRIVTNELSYGPRLSWEEKAKTSHAKQLLKQFKTD